MNRFKNIGPGIDQKNEVSYEKLLTVCQYMQHIFVWNIIICGLEINGSDDIWKYAEVKT